ncbi:MAG TPA: L,D-transpeptidase [Hyphomicrobiaceae bacterium]|nr:L,D-transpeptidase [Hyphomicrobiaceae bacterium]
MHLDRRKLVSLIAAAPFAAMSGAHAERYVAPDGFRPGDFTWQPDRAPSGAVVVIVSIPEQRVHVYRGGIEIGVSTCSTGKPGHRTPTGVFTILEKEREHVSSIYKGAQMPNMERLTWGGIALHAGNLPGYPASHGCVRLPLRFSALLFEVTHLGTVVIIADERTQPFSVVHPGIMLDSVAAAEARAVADHVGTKKKPTGWDATITYPVSSIVVSRADRRAYLTENGEQLADVPVAIANPATPLGTHIYTLVGPAADGSGLDWLSFGVGKAATERHIVQWQGDAALRRITFRDQNRAAAVARSLHPGSTLVLTDASSRPATRRTPDGFSVITADHTS